MKTRRVSPADWRSLAASAALVAASTGSAAAQDPAYGLWLTENQRAIVEIGPCDGAGGTACGHVRWMVEKTDAAGQPRTDVMNDQPALRNQPLCGLRVLGGFAQAGEGAWEDGYIYDAAEGDRYTATMEAQANGALEVRGYVLTPAFGRSQIWTRANDARDGC